METDELTSLKQQNARLRKAIKDSLGPGIWGLQKSGENLTHEEIVFLFARVFPALGIDHIKEIRTNFPDCICVKDGQEVSIEFEPVLSSFSNHIGKDDLSKCQYVVCWKDDLGLHSHIGEEIRRYEITVIELKRLYEEGKVRGRSPQSLEWSEKDLEKLSEKQLKALHAFIAMDKNILTSEEIGNYIEITGRPLGGVLGGFTDRKEWLMRQRPGGGWEFNRKYTQKVINTMKKFGLK